MAMQSNYGKWLPLHSIRTYKLPWLGQTIAPSCPVSHVTQWQRADVERESEQGITRIFPIVPLPLSASRFQLLRSINSDTEAVLLSPMLNSYWHTFHSNICPIPFWTWLNSQFLHRFVAMSTLITCWVHLHVLLRRHDKFWCTGVSCS